VADYVREFKIERIHNDILEVLDHGTRINLDINGEPFWLRFSIYPDADGNRYLIVVCSDPHVHEFSARMVRLPDDLAKAVTECEWLDSNALRELWERLMARAYGDPPGYFDDFVDEILKWLRDTCIKKQRQ